MTSDGDSDRWPFVKSTQSSGGKYLEVIFANPGTSEMQLVVSIDNNLEIRPVLGLFEGVLTGAAIISDFY